MNFNRYSQKIHEHNKQVGWWDNADECLYQKLQLVSTEVAEATEGARKNLMDDHLPERPMIEVELADALIRVLDFGGRLGLTILPNPDTLAAHAWCAPEGSIGKQMLGINADVIYLADAYEKHLVQNIVRGDWGQSLEDLGDCYEGLIMSIQKVSDNNGCYLESAVIAKMLYNESRADHKRENRGKENGKKF